MSEPLPNTPQQRLVWIGVFVTLSIVFLLRFGVLQSRGGVHDNDYKHIYAGSFILSQGGDPFEPELMFQAARQFKFESINPYVYPPTSGLLMRPFSLLSFPASSFVWYWFNLILALMCVLVGPWWLRIERANVARLISLFYLLFAFPFLRQMMAGQMNVALLGMLILALGLLIRRQSVLGGAVLAVAAAYKVAPFFIILALIPMRRWRAAVAGFIVFGALCFAAESWSGGGKTLSFLTELPNMGYGKSTWPEFGNAYYKDPFNQSINSLMFHLFEGGGEIQSWLALGSRGANFLTWLCSLVLLAGFALELRNHRRFHPVLGPWNSRDTRLFHLAFLLMLLLPSLMWDHYVVQTLIVVMMLCGSTELTRRPLRVPVLAAALLLLAWPVAFGHPDYRSGYGILIMSTRLWGVLLLLALVATDRDNAAGEDERIA